MMDTTQRRRQEAADWERLADGGCVCAVATKRLRLAGEGCVCGLATNSLGGETSAEKRPGGKGNKRKEPADDTAQSASRSRKAVKKRKVAAADPVTPAPRHGDATTGSTGLPSPPPHDDQAGEFSKRPSSLRGVD